jgi:hypothetical protein
MKPNQDPSDLFKELAPLEHAYSGAHANMEENYVIGSVFETAPESIILFYLDSSNSCERNGTGSS